MIIEERQEALAKGICEQKLPSINDELLINYAIENGVVSVILKNFAKKDDKRALAERLAKFEKQLKIIHILQKEEFDTVIHALKDYNIDFIVLKGWALSYSVYNEPFHRPKTDIDILISQSKKNDVKNVLSSLGFENPRGWEPESIIDQFSMRKTIANGVDANIDIHLELTNDKALQPLFLWTEIKGNSNLNNKLNCLTINKPYALLHAIIHLLHHNCNGDFLKLIWFYDIYLIVKSLTDSEKRIFLNKTEKSGLSQPIINVLTLQHRLFAIPNSLYLISELETMRSDSRYDYLNAPPSRTRVLLRNFKESKGFKEKLKIIKETCFPPQEEIFLKYGKKNRWPLPLLYLRRISAGISKYVFKSKK